MMMKVDLNRTMTTTMTALKQHLAAFKADAISARKEDLKEKIVQRGRTSQPKLLEILQAKTQANAVIATKLDIQKINARLNMLRKFLNGSRK